MTNLIRLEDALAAQVAAAYEAAATCAFNADFAAQGHHGLALEISALTPADARAALDRLLDEERRKAMEEVEKLVRTAADDAGDHPTAVAMRRVFGEIADRIRALIEKDAPTPPSR